MRHVLDNVTNMSVDWPRKYELMEMLKDAREGARPSYSQPVPSLSASNFCCQPGSPAWIGAAPAARTASQFL